MLSSEDNFTYKPYISKPPPVDKPVDNDISNLVQNKKNNFEIDPEAYYYDLNDLVQRNANTNKLTTEKASNIRDVEQTTFYNGNGNGNFMDAANKDSNDLNIDLFGFKLENDSNIMEKEPVGLFINKNIDATDIDDNSDTEEASRTVPPVTIYVTHRSTTPLISVTEAIKSRLDYIKLLNGSLTKYGLEWVDTEEEDERAIINSTEIVKETTTKKQESVKNEDVSSITKELVEEEKKALLKLNRDDVMTKKHMELLNSLDYGTITEGLMQEDSDAKDEKYVSDTYFL